MAKHKRRCAGEGTMFKRKNSKLLWQAAIPVPLQTGGTKKVYHYGSKEECKTWLTQMRYDIQMGKPVLDSNILLIDWIQIWIERYCGDIRETTRMNYTTYLKHIERHRIAQTPLKSLSTDDLQDFINFLKKSGKLSGEGGLSNKTIRNLFLMIKKSLKQAHGNLLIRHNPAEFCCLPKTQPKEKYFLSVDEMDRLLQASEGEHIQIAIILLMFTGIRIGELLALRHDCVQHDGDIWYLDIRGSLKRVKNFETGKTVLQVSDTKTEKSKRQVPLLPEVKEFLLAHMEQQNETASQSYGLYKHNPYLIDNGLGEKIDPTTFRKQFNALVMKAGIETPTTPHTLRKTWGSQSLKEGLPLQYISDIMGHSSTSVTEKYYLSTDIQGKNAAMSKLEGLAQNLLKNK